MVKNGKIVQKCFETSQTHYDKDDNPLVTDTLGTGRVTITLFEHAPAIDY